MVSQSVYPYLTFICSGGSVQKLSLMENMCEVLRNYELHYVAQNNKCLIFTVGMYLIVASSIFENVRNVNGNSSGRYLFKYAKLKEQSGFITYLY